MTRIKVQGTSGQWSNKELYITKSSKEARAILQIEEKSIPFSDYFRRLNIIWRWDNIP